MNGTSEKLPGNSQHSREVRWKRNERSWLTRRAREGRSNAESLHPREQPGRLPWEREDQRRQTLLWIEVRSHPNTRASVARRRCVEERASGFPSGTMQEKRTPPSSPLRTRRPYSDFSSSINTQLVWFAVEEQLLTSHCLLFSCFQSMQILNCANWKR